MIPETITIRKRKIGNLASVYIIAELSANHNQDFNQAVDLIKAAKDAGADAIKLQTYTPDTLTIRCNSDLFRVGKGSLWEGKTLYDLYKEAYTPWEWQPKLKQIANRLGLDLFSTPFDQSAVDFLEKMKVPAYKIASFELVDLPLIEYIAQTGKPIILSTGMADEKEIREAIGTIQGCGNNQIALLKCTSSYPAPVAEMNLRTIPDMVKRFKVPVGLSDHSLGWVTAVVAVSLGACIIEKHFTLSRSDPGPDSGFSMEPAEFKEMVRAIRLAEESLGSVSYGPVEHERQNLFFRRSLFVVENIKKGDMFSEKNIKSIRPSYGLPPKRIKEFKGKHASRDIPMGSPLSEEMSLEHTLKQRKRYHG
jgi:pseudaminic acid synthase